jgi:hypothetical protein
LYARLVPLNQRKAHYLWLPIKKIAAQHRAEAKEITDWLMPLEQRNKQ